jgi:hypothetical protein
MVFTIRIVLKLLLVRVFTFKKDNMKKTIILLLLSLIFYTSFSQKWKPNLGFEGGMGGGGMNNLLQSTNPLITDNSALKKTWAYSYGPFVQLMKPAFGFEVKLNLNSFENDAESFSTPESIKMKYFSIPVLVKVRLTSREGITAESWSDESYTLIGNTIYHTPSQYSAGGNKFTTSVFLYGGIQYDKLRSATHTYGTSTSVTDDISGSLTETGYSFIGGLEMTINMLSFDFSYLKGLKSVDPSVDNKVSGFFVKIKVRLI